MRAALPFFCAAGVSTRAFRGCCYRGIATGLLIWGDSRQDRVRRPQDLADPVEFTALRADVSPSPPNHIDGALWPRRSGHRGHRLARHAAAGRLRRPDSA